MHIPSAQAFHVPNHDLKAGKVVNCDGIEANVEKDKCPLEEGIDCVG